MSLLQSPEYAAYQAYRKAELVVLAAEGKSPVFQQLEALTNQAWQAYTALPGYLKACPVSNKLDLGAAAAITRFQLNS